MFPLSFSLRINFFEGGLGGRLSSSSSRQAGNPHEAASLPFLEGGPV